MAFFPRSSAPARTDKNYVNVSYGGKNKAIAIGSDGYVLPNCVGQVHGRWLECYGECYLSTNDADTFYDKSGWTSQDDHYQRGQTPVIGAVMCWDDLIAPGQPGRHGGHVCIVESINYDSNGNVVSVYTSNSGYNSSTWWMETFYPPYNYGASRPNYRFQGFIYPPGYVPPVPPTPTPKKKHFKWVLYANNFRNKRNI